MFKMKKFKVKEKYNKTMATILKERFFQFYKVPSVKLIYFDLKILWDLLLFTVLKIRIKLKVIETLKLIILKFIY
jgi:hypothetical protein